MGTPAFHNTRQQQQQQQCKGISAEIRNDEPEPCVNLGQSNSKQIRERERDKTSGLECQDPKSGDPLDHELTLQMVSSKRVNERASTVSRFDCCGAIDVLLLEIISRAHWLECCALTAKHKHARLCKVGGVRTECVKGAGPCQLMPRSLVPTTAVDNGKQWMRMTRRRVGVVFSCHFPQL